MAKYCGNCGRELSDEAKFCPNCGQEYIPRYKADHYSKPEEFDGPFDDFDNRSSTNPFESSNFLSKRYALLFSFYCYCFQS